jgi:hypothetical protein
MKTAMRRALAAAFALALLSGCMLEGGDSLVTPGGAEDFPNTVNSLGRIAAGDIAAGTQWEQAGTVQLPEMPALGGLDSLQLAPPQPTGKRAALAKIADALTDTLNLSLWTIDQSTGRYLEAYFFGRIYAYSYDSTATYVRRDTVVALYIGDRSAIGISTGISALITQIQAEPGKYLMPLEYRGAVQWASTGIRQGYRLRNTDSQGDLDAAEYAVTTPLPEGGTLRRGVKLYGPDGAFRTPGQTPEEVEILHRGVANDTLEWTVARDADGDRRLWAAGDSGIVDVNLYVRNPAAQPAVSSMRSYVHAMFRHTTDTDSLLQLVYQEKRWLRDGRVTGFALQGTIPGSVPAPGDTARMTVDTMYTPQDSMVVYSASYDLRAGSAPYRTAEHALLGFKVSKFWRKGPVFHVVSNFATSTPLPMGQGPFEGTMQSLAAYFSGDTVQTEGAIARDSLNLTIRQVKRGVTSSYEVALDAAGKLLRPPVVVTPDATLTAKRPARP